MKKAILVISVGSRFPVALKTVKIVEDKIENEFGTKVFRAFTSEFIIRRLCECDGINTDNVNSALEKLFDCGYTDIFCVPTHITNGTEFKKVCDAIDSFNDKMNIKLSRPLISSEEDYLRIAEIFKEQLTDKSRLYIFMAHGTGHSNDTLCDKLNYYFRHAGADNVYVGTLKDEQSNVLRYAADKHIKDITLMPLMFISGSHAKRDMAGTLKTAFEEHGFSVTCDMRGLGEVAEIREMYREHLKDIWE